MRWPWSKKPVPEPVEAKDLIALAARVNKLRKMIAWKVPDYAKHRSELRKITQGWPDTSERNLRRIHHLGLWLKQNPNAEPAVRKSMWLELERRMTRKNETPLGAEVRA